jgi:hypothetical protein
MRKRMAVVMMMMMRSESDTSDRNSQNYETMMDSTNYNRYFVTQ